MADIIIMPKLGFNMSEGKLVQWYKNEGDFIEKGEPLFSVETDKTNMDIEATGEGVVKKLLIEAGDKIPVTLPIAVIAAESEDASAAIADAEAQLANGGIHFTSDASEDNEVSLTAVDEMETQKNKDSDRLWITPRARRIAKENGLSPDDLSITGTGWSGGICEKDILDYLSDGRKKATAVAAAIASEKGLSLEKIQGTGVSGRIMKRDVENIHVNSDSEYTDDGKEILEKIPYAGVRKVIGDRLAESKFTAPHLYFTQKVNLENLLDIRKRINTIQEKKTSVTDYIARAAVIALIKYPDMNSSLLGETIVKYKSINLGIAVASPTGLIVPNIKDAQNMSVIELSKAATPLFEKAREGKLAIDEYSGGTFTISNLGMFGIENFTAIINPPEVGILSISSSKDEPVVITDEDGNQKIAIRPMMNIQLTVDHRVIDGLLAAQFVTEIKELLEDPIRLLI